MVKLRGVRSDSSDWHAPHDPDRDEHLALLKTDVVAWNRWREACPQIVPSYWYEDFSGADLAGADLRDAMLIETKFCGANLRGAALNRSILAGADLSHASLRGADLANVNLFQASLCEADLSAAQLPGANLQEAKLRGARLSKADLGGANLMLANLAGARLDSACFSKAVFAGATLTGARLRDADLIEANLARADLGGETDLRRARLERAILVDARLPGADLRDAHLAGANLLRADLGDAHLEASDLSGASFVQTRLPGARLDGSFVYGASVWDVLLDEKSSQKDLVVIPPEEGLMTVDNLKVAQFIYLLLRNENLRDVIDTVTRKAVLVLGSFARERKAVLDAIRAKLRALNCVPIVYDFEGSPRRNLRETVKTLAGLSRFVIVDITRPRSSPLEMDAVIPDSMIPFVPIIQKGEKPFATFRALQREYTDRMLDLLLYENAAKLIRHFEKDIMEPAVELEGKLLVRKTAPIATRRLGGSANGRPPARSRAAREPGGDRRTASRGA